MRPGGSAWRRPYGTGLHASPDVPPFPDQRLSDQRFHLFLGTDVDHRGDPSDPDEASTVEWRHFGQIARDLANGVIADGVVAIRPGHGLRGLRPQTRWFTYALTTIRYRAVSPPGGGRNGVCRSCRNETDGVPTCARRAASVTSPSMQLHP